VLPILKKQAGFVDETLLVSDTEPNQILALSFWNSKEDAERYQREQYPAIHEMVRHPLEAEPVIRIFNVDSSTTHGNRCGQSRLTDWARTLYSLAPGELSDSPAFCSTKRRRKHYGFEKCGGAPCGA